MEVEKLTSVTSCYHACPYFKIEGISQMKRQQFVTDAAGFDEGKARPILKIVKQLRGEGADEPSIIAKIQTRFNLSKGDAAFLVRCQ